MAVNFSSNVNISMPQQAKSGRNSVAGIVLLVLACGLFFWFLVLPKKSEVSAKQADLSTAKTEETTATQNLATFQALIKSLDTDSNKIKDLDQAIPLNGKIPQLQILLNDLANQSGVIVGDISVSQKEDGVISGDKTLLQNPYAVTRKLQTLSGTVYVKGSFEQLKTFLEKIEYSGRIIDISDIAIDPSADTTLNLKIGIQAYYLTQ